MKRIIFLILISITDQLAASQPVMFRPVEKTATHRLGDRMISVRIGRYGTNNRRVLIHLHDNETTALQAAKNVLSRQGGILVSLENSNERFISFSLKGRAFKFDPNRMFTDAGIMKTLRQQNDQVTEEAIKMVKRFAKFVKAKIPSTASTVIAVHNNDEGNLSVASYLPGGDYQKDVSSVHQVKRHDPDNFFLTTSTALYRRLKKEDFNTVLQHNRRSTDDGSLSVYYGRKKKSYVNVETEIGKLEEQERMLEAILRSVRSR